MDVRTLCLGALTLGDATGYEIRKMFEDGVFSHFLEASYGSIYPALTRLTEEGLVTCHSEQQEKRPDKKIYSVTAKGRTAFTEALLEPLAEDKFRSEFLFVMLFRFTGQKQRPPPKGAGPHPLAAPACLNRHISQFK